MHTNERDGVEKMSGVIHLLSPCWKRMQGEKRATVSYFSSSPSTCGYVKVERRKRRWPVACPRSSQVGSAHVRRDGNMCSPDWLRANVQLPDLCKKFSVRKNSRGRSLMLVFDR